MLNDQNITVPEHYEQIKIESEKLGFNMPSDLQTGSLLRTLAASKPGGRFLDLGTGTGLSLAWLAEGANQKSSIYTLDISEHWQNVAKAIFKGDDRINFYYEDGNDWLVNYKGEQFDLIFADAWPGKFDNLNEALQLVKPGGFYLIDDLLPQPNWPDGHQENVEQLINTLQSRTDFVYTTFGWSTGLMLFTRIK
ncbi:MAG: methyltransferase domain-containing protein [Mucilaginibacter sp.]